MVQQPNRRTPNGMYIGMRGGRKSLRLLDLYIIFPMWRAPEFVAEFNGRVAENIATNRSAHLINC